jgi:hypothetical protein
MAFTEIYSAFFKKIDAFSTGAPAYFCFQILLQSLPLVNHPFATSFLLFATFFSFIALESCRIFSKNLNYSPLPIPITPNPG